jgi:hypothetical protein
LKQQIPRSVGLPGAALLVALIALSAIPGVQAQPVYRNIVNQKFRTVGNGPQSALIVDVDNLNDTVAVRRAVERRYETLTRARIPSLRDSLARMRQAGLIPRGLALDLVDTAILRSRGRLALPAPNGRARANNELTFTVPRVGDPKPGGGNWTEAEGAWTNTNIADIPQLVNLLYAELKTNVLGSPGWNGNVLILNKDPLLGTNGEVFGALLVVNGSDVQIWFPNFREFNTRFLAMAQVMAQAFHGPLIIGYDAWEKGMARAAALVALRDLLPTLQAPPFNQTFNPSALGFYYTPYYDQFNQPPLGNDTFSPPTKTQQPINATSLAGMLVPRLQMSSTAWLKCFIENAGFFKNFNAAYYAAVAAQPGGNIPNDIGQLRNIAKGVLPTVEDLPFDQWYERQYILDTSVSVGPKLYVAYAPDLPATGTDSGASFFVIYYDTFRATNGQGDERDRNGTIQVVYWDYQFQNRLALPSFETVRIQNGFGSVAPFFNGIGGSPPDQMRVAVDFPINNNYTRIYFPAGRSGTESAPNDFYGVVVGADTGNLSVTYDGGGTINTTVVQGAFGARGASGAVPNGFSRTRIRFTPTNAQGQASGPAIDFRRNTAFSNQFDIAPIFQLVVPGPVETLSRTFAVGPQMISLPIQPLSPDLAAVLGTQPNSTLLAQYRQDLAGADKYLRYPSLPPYQPGYGLWSNFPFEVRANNIQGQRTDVLDALSIGLEFGWNMIGSPYNAPTNQLNVKTDLAFQYLGQDVLSLDDAVRRGWVAAGVIGYSTASGYQDITTTEVQTFPRNILETWKGYWIRVLVTEGLTLTFSNPNSRAARARSRSATRASVSNVSDPGGWRVQLSLSDSEGNQTAAHFGQSRSGSERFTPALDVASPPVFARTANLAVRFAPKDGENNAELLTDVRRSAAPAQWEFAVTVPQPEQTYTLTWNNTATLPRGMRLTLIDPVTGTRHLMNTSSGFSFRMGRGETTRRFQIVADPRSLGRLRISNVTATAPPYAPGRAAPQMTISCELSGAAELRMEIRQGGRIVRRLAAGRAVASGVSQFVWDQRDDQGRVLPAGAYTLQITARTPEGEQTRAAVPILLTR